LVAAPTRASSWGLSARSSVGVVEDGVVKEQRRDRGDEGQGEQHAEDACALLLLPRRLRRSADAYEQDGAHFLFSIPEIVFEAAITIYTIVKGFKPSPILDDARYTGVATGSMRPAIAAP
jgi:hypothetical protein